MVIACSKMQIKILVIRISSKNYPIGLQKINNPCQNPAINNQQATKNKKVKARTNPLQKNNKTNNTNPQTKTPTP